MVDLKPVIKHISPRISELSWDFKISDALLALKIEYLKHIQIEFHAAVEDIRSGYRSVSILWKAQKDQERLDRFLENIKVKPSALSNQVWKIPVCYDPQFGFDLEALAYSKGLAVEELVNLHTSPSYRIHFIGFLPGFPYLSGLDPRLATARKSIPDRNIPAGSVAIGGDQTGIYPQASPGGWHVIGRTPVSLFDFSSKIPFPFQMGDQLRFEPISRAEFESSFRSTFETL